MSEQDPLRDEGDAEVRFREAARLYDSAVISLNDLTEKVREGDVTDASKMLNTINVLHKATNALFEARKALEDKRKRAAGVVYDYAVDMSEARAEVGRLLDRLRDAGGSGSVPE
jgi:hypothetical protein